MRKSKVITILSTFMFLVFIFLGICVVELNLGLAASYADFFFVISFISLVIAAVAGRIYQSESEDGFDSDTNAKWEEWKKNNEQD